MEEMRTSWYSDLGKMMTTGRMLLILKILIKIGKEKRHGGGYFTLYQAGLKRKQDKS